MSDKTSRLKHNSSGQNTGKGRAYRSLALLVCALFIFGIIFLLRPLQTDSATSPGDTDSQQPEEVGGEPEPEQSAPLIPLGSEGDERPPAEIAREESAPPEPLPSNSQLEPVVDPTDPEPVEEPSEPVPGRVVIRFAEDASEADRQAYLDSLGGTVVGQIDQLDTVVIEVSEEVAAEPLPESPLVEESEPDYFVVALDDIAPSDPFYTEQWGLEVIGAPDAWAELPADAAQVTIAMIDSGICADHPDLAGRIVDGWDFVEDDAVPQDEAGHGCATAGVIAANMNNEIGIAGVAPNARIMPLRVLDSTGVGTYSDVAAAIVYAVDNGAPVINLSLGGGNPSSTLADAVNYAVEQDVLVIAAAGNTGSETILYPAAYEPVLSVGSIDPDLSISSFSATGNGVDVLAPGRNIMTTTADGEYGLKSGTSLAVPYVAGAAAIQIALGEPLPVDQNMLYIGSEEEVQEPGGDPVPPPEPSNRDSLQGMSTAGPNLSPDDDSDGVVMQAQAQISGVPAYTWYRGDGPTTAGMILGYWDGHGFADLVSGSAATQTAAVNAMMASTDHYDDYALPLDDEVSGILDDLSEPPPTDEHLDDSLADLMHTSQSYYDLYYGWDWFNYQDDGLRGYVNLVAPQYTTTIENRYWGYNLSWADYTAEIDAGRPVQMLVDSDGDGTTDRFVVGIGYSDDSGTQMYAAYNTEDTSVHWYEFAGIEAGQAWGIYGAVFFQIEYTTASAPDNDDFDDAAAITMSGGSYSDEQYNATATTDTDDPTFQCGDLFYGQGYNSIWYSYTPSASGDILLGTSSNTVDAVLAVWTGSRGSLTLEDCSDGGSLVYSMTASETFYVEVAAHSASDIGLVTFYADDDYTPLCSTVTEIPAIECEALVALYNDTDGTNWTNKNNWLTTNTPCTDWYGVECLDGSVSWLSLGENELTGTISPEVGNLDGLYDLWMPGNNLTGAIPSELGDISKLTTLWLSENQLNGSIPTTLGSASNLSYVNLGNNNLSSSIPAELGDLENLDTLILDSNQLTGNIPSALGNLSNLTYLSLLDNQLDGSIPTQLGNLTGLFYLDLGSNQLTGSIPTELGSLLNLEDMYLDTNQLTGSIPTQLGSLTSLSSLWLDTNQLDGSIPTQLGSLSNLEVLSLYSNQLTGTIPTELGNITNLSELYLGDNQLTGSIPTQLGNLTYLGTLDLAANQLDGTIPTQLGNLTYLEVLTLFANQLSGDIPPELTALTLLNPTYTDFGYNMLTASDAGLLTFLGTKDPDWAATQTIPPDGVQIDSYDATSVDLLWTPIAYTGDGGYYEVGYATTSGGPYTVHGQTTDKTVSTYTVDGLTPGTYYFLVVRTFTPAHGVQQNDLTSEWGDEVVSLPLTEGYYEQDAAGLFYSGTWHEQTHSQYSGGSTTFSGDPAAQVLFSMEGDTLTLIRTTGPTYGTQQVCIDAVCDTVSNTSATWLRRQPVTFGGLGSGVHTVTITNYSGTNDLDAVKIDNAGVLAVGLHEQTSGDLVFTGNWAEQTHSQYSGGTSLLSWDSASRLWFRFEGNTLTLIHTTGPTFGTLEVCIDGTCESVDNYSAEWVRRQNELFDDLGSGVHTATIRSTSGSYDIDAIQVNDTSVLTEGLHEQTSSDLVFTGNWAEQTHSQYSGGTSLL
ncbi:MAG: S8 family serine peptidase, partial [Anaerolineae bacterium]|nr:S8 family serine peptidase [Anaerolineae bacterium]